MAEIDAYREVYKELQEDLEKRRVQNDNPDLDAHSTAAVRGEIRYIRNLMGRLKDRARIA